MAGWWRRSRLALAALLLGIGATVVVGVLVPLRASGALDRQPPTVAAGQSARFGGPTAKLRITALFHRDGDPGVKVPRGAMILAVVVDLIPGGATSCTIDLARRGTDKIRWSPVSSPAELGYGLSDSTEHSCDTSGRASRPIEEVFLVPQAVYGDVVLRVTVTTHGISRTRDLLLPVKPRTDRASGSQPRPRHEQPVQDARDQRDPERLHHR